MEQSPTDTTSRRPSVAEYLARRHVQLPSTSVRWNAFESIWAHDAFPIAPTSSQLAMSSREYAPESTPSRSQPPVFACHASTHSERVHKTCTARGFRRCARVSETRTDPICDANHHGHVVDVKCILAPCLFQGMGSRCPRRVEKLPSFTLIRGEGVAWTADRFLFLVLPVSHHTGLPLHLNLTLDPMQQLELHGPVVQQAPETSPLLIIEVGLEEFELLPSFPVPIVNLLQFLQFLHRMTHTSNVYRVHGVEHIFWYHSLLQNVVLELLQLRVHPRQERPQRHLQIPELCDAHRPRLVHLSRRLRSQQQRGHQLRLELGKQDRMVRSDTRIC
mmetsp:Transcript_15227/g.43303  ORF Transcript_15227/g.43303 Transcript_15227/m.43303 type:complete len:332 (+) Transcript_15227:536-1531(+)